MYPSTENNSTLDSKSEGGDFSFKLSYLIFDPELKTILPSAKYAEGLQEFQDHCRERESFLSLFAFYNIFACSLGIYRQYELLKYDISSPIILTNALFTFFALICPAIAHIALKLFPQYATTWRQDAVEITWVFGIQCTFCFMMLVKVLGGECTHGDRYSFYECNSFLPLKKIPEDLTVILIMLPAVMNIMMKRVPWRVIAFIFLLGVVVLLYCVFGYGNVSSARAFFGALPMAVIALCEYRRMNVDVYLLSMRQKMLMNKIKLDADASAESLRYMLSNVAHDLKTVLNSKSHVLTLLFCLPICYSAAFGELVQRSGHDLRKRRGDAAHSSSSGDER